jgi:hypothetical protein
MSISLVFTWAISILALVGGNIGKLDEFVGCSSKYKGVLDSWNFIDQYLIEVDTSFCSDACPCYFESPAEYATNSTVYPYYAQWTKGPKYSATSFLDCTLTVQENTLTRYQNEVEEADKFSADDFAKYWEILEKKFECSGWCKTSYVNADTQTQMTMYKYMFSDVNR